MRWKKANTGRSFRHKKTLLFGIRSCDMMGILQSASFMTRDRRDVYSEAKRDAATIVVMACPGPQNETCFCTTMQSGPVAGKGFDLQFFDAGEFFIIQIGSGKGEAALSSFPLADLDDDLAGEKVEAFRQRSAEAIARVDSVPEAMNRLKDRTADEGVWERLGLKCIQCGGCTFVCPTCTCFNVCDHPTGSGAGGSRKVLGCMPVRRIHPRGVRSQSETHPGAAAEKAS